MKSIHHGEALPTRKLMKNCHRVGLTFRTQILAKYFQGKSSSFFPDTEVANHLLSLTGGLFKKANKWFRSPSFKVGQPRPNASAFAYMRGP